MVVFYIARLLVSTPNATENAPVRATVLGSHDGVFWFQLAANPAIPRAEAVATTAGPMRQLVFKGDHTGFTKWEQIAELAKAATLSNKLVTKLSWSIEEGEEGADAAHSVLWHGSWCRKRLARCGCKWAATSLPSR